MKTKQKYKFGTYQRTGAERFESGRTAVGTHTFHGLWVFAVSFYAHAWLRKARAGPCSFLAFDIDGTRIHRRFWDGTRSFPVFTTEQACQFLARK